MSQDSDFRTYYQDVNHITMMSGYVINADMRPRREIFMKYRQMAAEVIKKFLFGRNVKVNFCMERTGNRRL